MVIRDSSGLVLVSAVNKLGKAAIALYAKMLGIRYGRQLACERRYKHLIVETHSRVVLAFIDKGKSIMWDAGSLVFDIMDLVAECNDCRFQSSRQIHWLIA